MERLLGRGGGAGVNFSHASNRRRLAREQSAVIRRPLVADKGALAGFRRRRLMRGDPCTMGDTGKIRPKEA